jgi:AAA+ superfamily predicted ATPase
MRSSRLLITRMQDVGDYVGAPSPEHYADRIRRLGAGGSPRSVLIRGPSGVGKSVLSRKIAQALGGGESKTLKITGKAFNYAESSTLEQLIRIIRPNVLLVDDVSFHADRIESLLASMEALRVDGVVVILTLMDNDVKVRPGGSYFHGMRPGRIDDVVVLQAPDAWNRDLILRHYYKKMGVSVPDMHGDIVRGTDGMTAAYLREVVIRLRAFGCDGLKSELQMIRYMAPVSEDSESRRGRKTGEVCDGR